METESATAKKRKTALVLSGGGARGAYEVGVVKALTRQGINFDLVIGTSIGAINAAFVAQGDMERWQNVWYRLRTSDIYHGLSARRIVQLIRGGCMGILDATPLESVLRAELDLQIIKKGTTTAGWCITDLCSLETLLVTTDDLLCTEEFIDTLMATSAIPLFFPPRSFRGKGLFIDGGIVRNTPVKFALELGVEEVYTVLLNSVAAETRPTNLMESFTRTVELILDSSARNAISFANFYNTVLSKEIAEGNSVPRCLKLHVLKPRETLSASMMEFDPDQSRTLIEVGYRDTLTHLERAEFADCRCLSEEKVSQYWF